MRSFTALLNPISGGGRAARQWAPIAERIGNAGATVREEITRSREHAINLGMAAAARGIGLQTQILNVGNSQEINAAFAAFGTSRSSTLNCDIASTPLH